MDVPERRHPFARADPTLDDFKGRKLIASNAIAAKIVTALGATPISFRPDEAYTAIQRGTTDGAVMPFTGMETFKVHEVTRHHLDAALGSDSGACCSSTASATSAAGGGQGRDRQAFLPAAVARNSAQRPTSNGRSRATW